MFSLDCLIQDALVNNDDALVNVVNLKICEKQESQPGFLAKIG